MWNLEKLAKLVGGNLISPGSSSIDEKQIVEGAASISYAKQNEITFVTSDKFLEQFERSPAFATITSTTLCSQLKPCIQVSNPEAAFSKVVALFRTPRERTKVGISSQAIVSPSAKISDDVCIHPGAVIMDNVEIECGTIIFPNVTVMENCQIGSNTKIFPGAVLYENTKIGDRCIIHAGVVIGAYGFGYSTVRGHHRLSAQYGNVVIESDVEIGANSTIDRSTYDSTIIGSGTKIDDLVMIGHNCQIGRHNLLCSQVGVAGSCTTGDYVVMGGQVGMADHLDIGSHAAIGAKSGLMHDVPEGQRVFGIPARPARDEMLFIANKGKLPEMRKAIRQLERELERLKNQIESPNPDQARKAA